jgi:sulfur-carrier protein
MAAVRIPPTLRAEVGGIRELDARGDTVRAVIEDLAARYPPLGAQLLADGELASYVNVYLGGEDIKTLDGLDTPVYDSETIILLPAMAGGASLAGVGSRRAQPSGAAGSAGA